MQETTNQQTNQPKKHTSNQASFPNKPATFNCNVWLRSAGKQVQPGFQRPKEPYHSEQVNLGKLSSVLKLYTTLHLFHFARFCKGHHTARALLRKQRAVLLRAHFWENKRGAALACFAEKMQGAAGTFFVLLGSGRGTGHTQEICSTKAHQSKSSQEPKTQRAIPL
jgi:hypothetical protein